MNAAGRRRSGKGSYTFPFTGVSVGQVSARGRRSGKGSYTFPFTGVSVGQVSARGSGGSNSSAAGALLSLGMCCRGMLQTDQCGSVSARDVWVYRCLSSVSQ